MLTGVIKLFDPVKNIGFIEPNGAKKGDPDVFFHASAMQGVEKLVSGQWVQFEVIPGYVSKYGTQKAAMVALCGPKRVRSETYGTD